MKAYLLIFVLLMTTVAACEKDKDKQESEPIDLPISRLENRVEIQIQGYDGTDLLDRQNEGHYKDGDIRMPHSYDSLNSITVASYSHEMDYFYLGLLLNYPKPNIEKGKEYREEVVCGIIFGDNEADSIKALYEVMYFNGNEEGVMGAPSAGYTVILQEARFNDTLIYEIQASENPDWEPTIIEKEFN